MRKTLLVSAGILLLTVGVGIGWFTGTRSNGAASSLVGAGGNAQPGTRYRAGDPELLAPPPSWEEWKYPGSRVHKAGNAGRRFIGTIDAGAVDRVALVSEDDFEKVWAFYRDKVEQKVLAAARTPPAVSGQDEGDRKAMTVTIYDRPYACTTEGPESDLLQAKAFWVQSLRYKLAGSIYRAKGSDATSILLFYCPSGEFIGLLKDRLITE
jgi:hypothetical protein